MYKAKGEALSTTFGKGHGIAAYCVRLIVAEGETLNKTFGKGHGIGKYRVRTCEMPRERR